MSVQASVGFDSHYLPGRWTPVTVTLENQSSAKATAGDAGEFSGSVRIISSGAGGDQTPMAFARQVLLPPNDRKRLTIYAKFPASGSSAEVQLVTGAGRRVAAVQVPRKPVSGDQPLAAYVRATDAAITLAPVADLPVPRLAPIDPEHLPDQWYGYDGLSLLVIPRLTDKMLDAPRSEAIRAWVSQGGTLLLVGGRHASSFQSSSLEDLLPGTLAGSSAVTLGEKGVRAASDGLESTAPVQRFQISTIEPGADSRIWLQAGDVPVLVGKPYGAGEVLFLASDWSPRLFEQIPVRQFLHTWLVTRQNFGGARRRLETVFPYADPAVFGLGSASALPDPVLVGVVLVSYLVVVGPANFWFLARRRRLELAWVTVPVVVIIFSGGIYALGSWIRGSSSYLRSYHLVTGEVGAAQARCSTLTLAYFPQNTHETLSLDPSAHSTAAGQTIWEEGDKRHLPYFSPGPGPHGARSADLLLVNQAPDGMRLENKRILQWAYDFSRFESVVSLGGTVDTTLTLAAEQAVVEVRNATDQLLEDICLVAGDRAWSVEPDTVAPGSSARCEVALGAGGQPLTQLKAEHVAMEGSRSAVFAGLAASLASSDQLRSDLPSPLLLARSPKKPVSVRLAGHVAVESHHTFLALRIPPEAVKITSVPPVPVPADLLDNGGGHYRSEWDEVVIPGSTPVTFAALLPTSRGDDTSVSVRVSWTPADTVSIGCDVYDFGDWRWKTVGLEQIRATSRRLGVDQFPHASLPDTAGKTALLQTELVSDPFHPVTGAVLVRLSPAPGERKGRGQLAFGRPVVEQFVTRR